MEDNRFNLPKPSVKEIWGLLDMCRQKRQSGFTLPELLITLTMLSVIATFTIPKVLNSQQEAKSKAIAKEAAGALSAAFMAYQQVNAISADTSLSDLTPYLNYVKVATNGAIDMIYGVTGSNPCDSSSPCYVLANGAVIRDPYQKTAPGTGNRFGSKATTHYIYFDVDPNGVLDHSATTNGPGKSVDFDLYTNGRIVDAAACKPGDTTYLGATAYSAWCPGQSPPWFSWQ